MALRRREERDGRCDDSAGGIRNTGEGDESAPTRLGPGGKPIAAAGYEGFTRGSWSELVSTSPRTAGYINVLFRTYGAYNVGFGILAIAIILTAFRRGERWAWWALLAGNTITLVSAMIYDRTVNAIGPFEMSEYLGLAMIYGALALTIPGRVSGPRAARDP